MEITPEFIAAIKKYIGIGIFSDGMAAVKIYYQWRPIWGYINTKGEEVIPLKIQAQFVGRFSEGLAFVCPGVYYGDSDSDAYVIDKTGKRVFNVNNFYLDACGESMDSEDMPYFIDGKLYVISYIDNDFKYSIYDHDGKKLGVVGDEEGQAYYKSHEAGDYVIVSKSGNGRDDYDNFGRDYVYGLNDMLGKQVLATEYDAINGKKEGTTKFCNGVVMVTLTEYNEEWDGPDGCVGFHIGYADMNGNDTFSAALKRRCKQSKIEAQQSYSKVEIPAN